MPRVKWTAFGGVERTGEALDIVQPGYVPELPPGIARHRRRFIAEPSTKARMLVRVVTHGDGDLYYAPMVGALEEA